ncbi:MAG: hypothetical protein ABFD75_09910 [Smithella sp.]
MKLAVTDNTKVKKDKGKTEMISMTLKLPVDLYDKLKQGSAQSKKPIGTIIEEWADKYVSTQDVSINLATLMKHTPVRLKTEPGIRLKGLTVLVSHRHHSLIRLESLRRNSTIRDLLRYWIKEKTVLGAETDKDKRPPPTV